MDNDDDRQLGPGRRDFLKASLAAAVASASQSALSQSAASQSAAARPAGADDERAAPPTLAVDDFERADSLYLGDGWESLNPGYFELRDHSLRRRLHNLGDRKPGTWFPWHWETHRGRPMPEDYDPSLPLGIVWRREWKLAGNFAVVLQGRIEREVPAAAESSWAMHEKGYALLGIVFGGRSLYESWEGGARSGDAAWLAAWRDDGRLGIYDHAQAALVPAAAGSEQRATPPRAQESFRLKLRVSKASAPELANVTCTLSVGGRTTSVVARGVSRKKFTEGFFGIVGRGLLDWKVDRVLLELGTNRPLDVPVCQLHVCYALGDTLERRGDRWQCKFIALFRSDGRRAALRIATSPNPAGGWAAVPVAAEAPIVTSDFRASTAVFDAVLPADPAEQTLYYTVWKDGNDVTADPRPGTASMSPGMGLVGAMPESGQYVGRLPRLAAPYRICGLSCHAINENQADLPRIARFQENWVHDQPTREAYRHLDDYGFQVMLWEDDVWYLELIFAPPSTQDAYKVIQTTLGGPTTRWQMMRHWNVVNPGDHDYGMDDVKGPEQLAVRTHDDLGQDSHYLGRNFQIVAHLAAGEEQPSAIGNPRRWRRWKMPAGDFSLIILDARLWRTSQDTRLWAKEGWGQHATLYSRQDPTRSLLGEQQFAWLEQILTTDAAPLICMTGINGLHPIFTGVPWGRKEEDLVFDERDRVAADLAGWVKMGCQRVLELFGRREGVVSVYGDVHLGSITLDDEHRVYECSFGPIGRTGARAMKPDFGRQMRDYNNRALELIALYHEKYGNPDRQPIAGPGYWNFLEMQFDPRDENTAFALKIRNLIDEPGVEPRGGGHVEARATTTGRAHRCLLPPVKTLPSAEVQLAYLDGRPIRGVRSGPAGTLNTAGLVDVEPGTRLLMTAHQGDRAEAQVIVTLPLRTREQG